MQCPNFHLRSAIKIFSLLFCGFLFVFKNSTDFSKISSENFYSKIEAEEEFLIKFKPTKNELEFPLAFSILFHKNFRQFERLFFVLHRHWNFFCIHVDAKVEVEIYEKIFKIQEEFKNVFVLPKRLNLTWGSPEILTATLNCALALNRSNWSWKYLINFAGSEFPLKTNAEMVQILRQLPFSL